MKTLLTFSLCLLATAAHADFGPRHGHGGFDHNGGFHRPVASCAAIESNASQAEQQLAQANVMLMNNAQLCPGGWNSNAACMMMIANAVNQATSANQQAQAELQRLRDAQASVQEAQSQVNLATANLMNLGNLCGNNMVCVVAYQNLYNQSLANLQRSQEILHHVCY